MTDTRFPIGTKVNFIKCSGYDDLTGEVVGFGLTFLGTNYHIILMDKPLPNKNDRAIIMTEHYLEKI